MTTAQLTPLKAIGLGLTFGAIGSFVQSIFFKATGSITPENPKDAFTPPEPQQKDETATATVARRFVEGFMARGPLTDEQKQTGGQVVHYLFGAGWGMTYGLVRPSLSRKTPDIALWLGFSTAVWMIADNFILPAFRLGAWPQKYPPKVHLYAWVAHLAYGAAVVGGVRGTEEIISHPERLPELVQRAFPSLVHPAPSLAHPTAASA